MGLTIGLSSSSFFLPLHLKYLVSHQQANERELLQAKLLKLPAYYQYQRLTQVKGSTAWLQASRVLASNDGFIATELATFYQNRKALSQAKLWYQKAIELNNNMARILFANLLTKQEKYQQALLTLAPIPNNEQAILLATKIAIFQGQIRNVSRLLSKLSTFTEGRQLVNKIKHYQVIDELPSQQAINALSSINTANNNCVADIQMFATNLADLTYLEKLLQGFSRHPLSTYACFTAVRYIPLAELGCTHEKQKRIQCNEAIWDDKLTTISTRFVGALLPNGGANVNSGIMYLDNQDTVDVLAHEVAHLLGFIDEYPLPKNHAKCAMQQSQAFSHNIVVIKSSYHGERHKIRSQVLQQISWRHFIDDNTPIMHFENNRWHLGTPAAFSEKIGLFLSDTCGHQSTNFAMENASFASYKPIKQQSQLTYFELPFPVQYQQILAAEPNLFLMPSFHYNIVEAKGKSQKIPLGD